MNLATQNGLGGRNKRMVLRTAAVLAVITTLFLTDCHFGNPGGIGGSGSETTNSFVGKWEVTDANAKFVSFELTKDRVYIVVERIENPPPTIPTKVHTGKYTVSGSKIILTDFGTLEFEIDLSPNETATVKLQLDGSSDIYEFNVERAVEMASTANTDLICRHWKLARQAVNQEPWDAAPTPEQTMLLSKAGTLLRTVAYSNNQSITRLVQWKWVDEYENSFYVSDWRTGDWPDQDTDMMRVVILTETTLITTETSESTGTSGYGDILTSEWEPVR